MNPLLLLVTLLGMLLAAVEAHLQQEAAADPLLVPVSLERLMPALEQTWPPHRHGEVLAVVECESGGDPQAVGDGGRAFGLLQIRADHWPHLAAEHDLLDLEDNLRAGRRAFLEWAAVFEEPGWNAWSCRP